MYMPDTIGNILDGKMFVFDITQVILLTGLASVIIPALMIYLTLALTAKANRWTNIIVATVYIPYNLFNLAGEAWKHMVFGTAGEVVLLSLITHNSWKWPRQGSEP
jgi:roadblock/LC7 domain-containing protein